MTEAAAAPAPLPPGPAAPAAKRGLDVRTYVLAGCSVAGTLCASLAANTEINFVFAIASAVFGGLIVLLTAAPSVGVAAAPAPSAPAVAQAAEAVPTAPPRAPALRSPAAGSVGIGITAGILSFIMNQIAQVAVGMGVFNIVGAEITSDQMIYVTGMIGMTVVAVKTPFDLLVGAFHLSRARNLFAALGMFVVTYLFCYFVEQTISATMGASGLFNVISLYGAEALLWGLVYVIVVPTLAQGIGAFGARLAAWLTRRPG